MKVATYMSASPSPPSSADNSRGPLTKRSMSASWLDLNSDHHSSSGGATPQRLHRALSGFQEQQAQQALNFGRQVSQLTIMPRLGLEFIDLKNIGQGGFGTVFTARSVVDERQYAIKTVTFRFKPRYMFESKRINSLVMKEAKLLAGFDHPNVVRYYQAWIEDARYEVKAGRDLCDGDTLSKSMTNAWDQTQTLDGTQWGRAGCTGTTVTDSAIDYDETVSQSVDGVTLDQSYGMMYRGCSNSPNDRVATFSVTVCMQMAFYSGNTLKHWLDDPSQARRISDIHRIFLQIVKAVDYIHHQGLVHRDLKPANIFMCEDGVKVGDFGLTKMQGDVEEGVPRVLRRVGSKAVHTVGIGTPMYASPEQMNGTCLACKSDVFSLGIIFTEMLMKFGTQMERFTVLGKVRRGELPDEVKDKYPKEAELISSMIEEEPYERPDAFEILEEGFLSEKGVPPSAERERESMDIRARVFALEDENCMLKRKVAAMEAKLRSAGLEVPEVEDTCSTHSDSDEESEESE